MTESLKQIVNRENFVQQKNKFINSISELCTEAVNRSISYGSDNDSSMDNQQILHMEIKQLKRENTFLKTKIQQLKKGKHPKLQINKKKSINCLNAIKKRPQSKIISQFSIEYFMQQITNLLKSVSILFKAQIPEKDWIKFTENDRLKISNLQQYQLIAQQKQFSVKINKKLELLALKNQSQRYQQLLQIFGQFYRTKKQCQKRIKDKIEEYIKNTIEMSKNIIDRAQIKALKSSCVYTTKNYQEDTSQNQFDEVTNSNSQQQIFAFQKFKRESPKITKNQEKYQLSYSVIVQPQLTDIFV